MAFSFVVDVFLFLAAAFCGAGVGLLCAKVLGLVASWGYKIIANTRWWAAKRHRAGD